MSCLGKIFSKILNFRLVNWLTENNILAEEQLGFVKENRTTDAHIMLYNLIQKYCKKGKKDFIRVLLILKRHLIKYREQSY